MVRRTVRRRVVSCLPRLVEVCEPRVLLAAGDLDLSFGASGVAHYGPGAEPGPFTTASDRQGRILVSSLSKVPFVVGADPSLYEGRLIRFTTTGQLDTSFGTGGVVVPVPATSVASVRPGSVVVDTDGSIVWAYARSSSGATSLVVQRYSENGTLLTTFDTSGIAVDPNGRSALRLFIQPGGKVVSQGVRFLPDGTRDLSFGTNGAIPLGDFTLQAMQSDGKLLAGRSVDRGELVRIARFTVDGAADPEFLHDGVALAAVGHPPYQSIRQITKVYLQADGKILVVDEAISTSQSVIQIIRLNPNGVRDESFSRIYKLENGNAGAQIFFGLLVQPDGRIVLDVSNAGGGSTDQELLRYNSDGTFDRSLVLLFDTGMYLKPEETLLSQPEGRVLVSSLLSPAIRLSRYELGEMDYRQLATPFYRAYNPTADYHFFTTSQGEFRNAVQNGYRDEAAGNTGFALLNSAAPGATALFRLYNLQTGRHYYTANAAERDALVALNPPPTTGPDTRTIGWRYETNEGYIFTAAAVHAVPIFRLYNQSTGTHLYTENAATKEAILSQNPGVWFEHEPLGFAYPTNGSGQVTAPAAASAVAVSAGDAPVSVESATLPVGSDLSSSNLASLVAIPESRQMGVPGPGWALVPDDATAGPPQGRVPEEELVDDVYVRVGDLTNLLDEA